jgi:hypothetical protein
MAVKFIKRAFDEDDTIAAVIKHVNKNEELGDNELIFLTRSFLKANGLRPPIAYKEYLIPKLVEDE